MARRSPGLDVDPGATTNLCMAEYRLGEGARLRIGPGVTTERRPGALRFLLEAGARVEIGERTWLRTDLGPIVIAAFEGAELRLGPDCFLNGAHLSAKCRLVLGRRVWVGPGSRVFDSDQHDLDADRLERREPLQLDDHVWVASDATVLRGASIGAHSIVGAGSVVTKPVPPHTIVAGSPARPVGSVGDRSQAP